MGIELHPTPPDMLVVNLFGVLTHAEFTQAQHSAAEMLNTHGPRRILVNVEALTDFDPEGDWGDLSFQLPDRLITKMAIVGSPKIKAMALMFVGKGLRKFPVEFFTSKELAGARAWLQQGELAPHA
jgi:hypothetical protein